MTREAKTGVLYMIPTTLGECDPATVFPPYLISVVESIDHFIVENEKTARKFIKLLAPQKPQPTLILSALNKHTDPSEFQSMLAPCKNGNNVGLMSEAGCPGIADPGSAIALIAHQSGIKVVPLVGPSSILLAMMASGMNGQGFAFNGYLPIDKAEKKNALKNFEKTSSDKNQSQIFIETPYRNNKLIEDILQSLQPSTLLCIAADITLPTEFIRTLPVSQWKKLNIDIHNRPAIFILHKS